MSLPPPAEPLSEAEAAQLFEAVFHGASGVLIAVSGGSDSMALLGLMARWRDAPPIAAATVDHGLRRASADEGRLAERAAARLGLPHAILHWSGSKPTSGLQEAAREARYALLTREARARGFSHIATAHHADDQAETVLMRLAAGSGIGGLAAMRLISQRGGLVHARPLLSIRKDRLTATSGVLRLPWSEDSSNIDPRFGRARMRRVLGSLAMEGMTVERLSKLASRAARADEALEMAARSALSAAGPTLTGGATRVNWLSLADQPSEIRLRALSEVIRSTPGAPDRLNLEKLEAMATALDEAAAGSRRLRRSIGSLIATLQPDGFLTLAPAPARRRGTGTPFDPEKR